MIQFALTTDPACSIGQAVALALRHGGHRPRLTRRKDAATELLHSRGEQYERSRGPIAVLNSARAHLAAPAAPSHMLPLLALLDQIGATREPQDLDLHIFRLREQLSRIERQIAPRSNDRPPGLADCLLAAIWWRIAVLDRHFATFIGLGFPALQRHGHWLLAQSDAEDVLDATASTTLVARIAASRAVIGPGGMLALWQNGLGPEAGAAQPHH